MNDQFDKYSEEQAFRVAYLIAGYIRGTLSTTEHNELDEWVSASDENMQLFERLTDEKNIEEATKWIEERKTAEALQRTKKRIGFTRSASRKSLVRILSYGVAASVIIAMGLLIYFKVFNKKDTAPEIVKAIPVDILPGSDRATLTLENGTVITLDNKANDTSINGQMKILQQQGEIVYTDQTTGNPIAYHTLNIPRKGHYKLILPDGTKVWLNAESSIRYPVSFTGAERKVFVTGETYFEVAKDKTKPFRVVTNDIVVEALGTIFNINAYPNEPFVNATLVEGSILVSKGNTDNVLKPGQQAKISGAEFTISNVDINDEIAWKNNQFKFTNTPLDVIMRQVERWYDAEIVYESKPTDHFNAEVSKDVPVSKLLHFLELTNRVHFKIENKKIIVLK